MNHDYIQFKKQREIGEIISISFKFLRENYKTFFRLLFKIAGPAFIILIAALVYYSYATLGSSMGSGLFNSGDFLISMGILLIAVMIFFSVAYTTVFNLIRSYILNDGAIKDKEVATWVKQDFGKMLGLGIISWILLFAGFILLFIPGIYLSVPLSIATATLIFSREGILDSIGEAFSLVKENWWTSFITLILIWGIIYITSLIFQVPLIIYTFIKAFTVSQEGSAADMSGMFDWVYISLMVVSSLIQYVLYSIIPIGVSFLYFHLNEKKNFTGAYESIDNLGNGS